jgi:hypothetical protein
MALEAVLCREESKGHGMTAIAADVILTHSGKYVAPGRLEPEDIEVIDIAHALSHQCRFSGHTRVFYSVGEHSCRCCDLVEELTGDPHEMLWALMHDASEAYLVDLPRPIKHAASQLGEAYRVMEQNAMEAVTVAMGLEPEMPAVVSYADTVLLATERRDLMPARGDWRTWLDGVSPLPVEIEPWKPGVAKYGFMRRYVTLISKLGR